VDASNLAKLSGLHQLDGAAIVRQVIVDVVTHLADALVLERRVGHCAPFSDAVAERFLDEHVLACLEGVNRRDCMPVVRGDDYHRIDFFQIEQPAVVSEVLRRRPARFFNCGYGAV
jgi:hypothetical protein